MEVFATSNFSIRFRRWSRKSYAVFLALGRVVTIGTLHSCVLNQLSKKCVRLISLPNFFSILFDDFSDRGRVFFIALTESIKGLFVHSRLNRDLFVPFLHFYMSNEKRLKDFLLVAFSFI